MAEPSAALLMFISARHAERRVQEAVLAAGHDDLSPAMMRIAGQVAEEGSRVTELAERSQITKQSASVLVEQLSRAGYVSRVPDPTDARAKLVVLAERGRDVQRVARREERAIEREWTRHLGVGGMAELRRALSGLRAITDPYL
ncbi:MarR family transcriptional regulator [Nocardioides silvaticus]|uniref:MarR family transcriptional regulator n=1 Tax=Nocardioides silvaticus TaxID=2201891 RepID=A0A316TPR8_9ACTN|nr:MarR family transcriptional regulator [Nocardioides silvaticus]PWN05025.1 MarR family transcriptional regulator [Nocardioides silvaticus]